MRLLSFLSPALRSANHGPHDEPPAAWRGRFQMFSWRRVTSRTDYGIRTDLLRCKVGTQDHVHVHARDHRGSVDDGQLGDIGGDAVEDALTQLWVSALATAEHDG